MATRTPAVKELPSKCPKTPKDFSLKVDSVRAQTLGSQLRVGYDVCGLAAGTPFTTDITVRRIGQSKLGRMFGGSVNPVVEPGLLAVASSPRAHQRQQIDISALPTGRYSLEVGVTDAKKRKQQARREFEIQEKK